MKKINFYLLFFIGFIFLSFQFYQKKKVNDFDKEQKLRELISKTQILELPIFLDINNSEKYANLTGLGKLINPNIKYESDVTPVLGVLPDTSNYYHFLCYGIGDALYPKMISFDKKGNLLQDKLICLTDNLYIFEEVEISYQTSTVSLSKSERGTEITLLNITKGKRFREFESNTANTNLTDSLFKSSLHSVIIKLHIKLYCLFVLLSIY